MRDLRITLWQCAQHSADVAGNLSRLRDTALQAAADGAALLVCPEMVLTGYAVDAVTTQALAEAVDGPSARAVGAIAREAGIAIVHGYVERDADGRLFNAVQAMDADGKHRANYRKTHLFGALDRERFTAGDGAPVVFELDGWRIGLLICYDVEFPEAVRGLALQGVDLVVVPTANMAGYEVVPQVLVPARAYENQVVVAYANCCGAEGALVYGGASAVAGPDGRLLATAGVEPRLLTCTLSPRGLHALPYLADRRPGTYR